MNLSRRTALPSVVALVIGAILVACSGPSAGPSSEAKTLHSKQRLLLVGIDGLEWDVVLPMLSDGRLPTLARLMKEGSFGELSSMEPTFSPIIWTSIATGVGRDSHGIAGFAIKDEEHDSEALYSSQDRTVKAFWNILTDYERTVNVVGWWITYPAEAIRGVMVAQANTSSVAEIREGARPWKGALYEGVSGQVYPPELQDELLKTVPEVEGRIDALKERIFGDIEQQLDGVTSVLWEKCRWALRADAIYAEIAEQLILRDPDFDVTAVYFGATDVFGHRFWRYLFPDEFDHRPTDEEIALYGDLIPAYYEEVDRLLGRLIGAAPKGTNVMVVTDHGMRPAHRKRTYEPGHTAKYLRSGGHPKAPSGVFVAAGPAFANGGLKVSGKLERDDLPDVGNVIDITPTMLAVLGVPVGKDMTGRVLGDLLSPEFRKRHEVAWVETHTTAEWLEARRAAERVMPLDQEERLEQLRSLGYIE